MECPVTVVVPVYQSERYLAETLDSIMSQTRRPAEVMVVDDGSPDRSVEISREYAGVRVVAHEKNLGLAEALNTGVKEATQDWISFLDADDLWLPNKLEAQWKLIEELENGAKNRLFFTHLEQFISPELSEEAKADIRIPKKISKGIMKNTMLLHRRVFDEVGLFDSQWRTGDFVDWYARAKDLNIEETVLDNVLVRRRIHEENTGRQNRAFRNEFASIMMQSIKRRKEQKSERFTDR